MDVHDGLSLLKGFQNHGVGSSAGSFFGGRAGSHLASTLGATLIAEVTLARPTATSPGREFDVLVGAPTGVTQVEADSPYYAGTIAFFGSMMNMAGMESDVTFAVPMPKTAEAFHNLALGANSPVSIRIVPSHGHGEKAPALKAASIRAR